MTKSLTTEDRALLQRYYDGDELSEDRVEAVQRLLSDSSSARVFMTTLEELTLAAQAAEEYVWESSGAPDAAHVASAAASASALVEEPLEALAPLLERFHDGEVVAEEMAAVSALLEERDDVADYLAGLEEIGSGVVHGEREAVARVSFDGFWDAVSGRLDSEAAAYDAEEHRVLLYRYHDDEATPSEREQVEGWVASGVAEVVDTLAALSEVRLAATAGIELAQDRADLSTLWHNIEDALDDEIESKGENVVSFERARREKKGFVQEYRQALVGAVAAAAAVAMVLGVFSEQILGPREKVIVEKTVVIVDSVEYAPGASVMVNSPMQPASAVVTSAGADEDAEDAEPTVIWLLDSAGDDSGAGAADDATPSEASDEEAEEVKPSEEAGGQPI